MLRPVESGYNPGAVRDQFQLEAVEPGASPGGCGRQVPAGRRSPVPAAVPAGAAAIRRLPVHNGAQAGSSRASRRSGQGPLGQGPLGQPPQSQGPAGPANPDLGAGPSPSGPGSGGQPIAPVVPMEQPGQGYGGNRAAAYGGPRPVNGPVALVGQPPPSARPPTPVRRGRATEGPVSRVGQASSRSARARRLSRAEPGSPAASGRAAGRGRIAGLFRRSVRRLPLRRGAVRARGGPGVRRVGGPRRARALAGSRACQEAPDAV